MDNSERRRNKHDIYLHSYSYIKLTQPGAKEKMVQFKQSCRFRHIGLSLMQDFVVQPFYNFILGSKVILHAI